MTKINHDSSKNQEIKRQFVQREVYSCVTSMVEYIIKKSFEENDTPFSYDDIINMYEPVCGCGESYFKKSENEEGEEIYTCYCGKEYTEEEFRELDTEPQEIFEWWMVSNWLAEKLYEKGEPVLLDEGIWGRTCTGQAILLDGVISRICEEMEILEGQKNEWNV